MPIHIMIDIETMATTPDAAILSIGAAAFHLEYGVFDMCYQPVSLESQKLGHKSRRFCDRTEQWWADQSKDARQVFTDSNQMDLEFAIYDFMEWVDQFGHLPGAIPKNIWGNSPSFDCEILKNAAGQFAVDVPWQFWQERCFRTVRALYPGVGLPERIGPAHNALSDALYQANHLLAIARTFNLPL